MRTIRHLVWIAALLLSVRLASAGEPPPLWSIAAVRDWSGKVAIEGVPVRVRGVVTWTEVTNRIFASPNLYWFTIQDSSGGIGIRVGLARQDHIWRGDDAALTRIAPGAEVEVEGLRTSGGFAPIIKPKTIRILGEQPLPPARPMVPARFFAGADACERVEASGVVQGFHRWEYGWVLQLDANPGSFTAEVSFLDLKDPGPLVDAVVRLRGVAATRFNMRGEVKGVRLIVSQASDITVEKPATPSPFDAPIVPLNQLLSFRHEPLGPHRQVVEGTVIYVQSGHLFYLQNRDAAVRVEMLSPENLQPGERVQVAGFVDMRRQVAGLTGAVLRKLGSSGGVPPPLPILPGEILARDALAVASAQLAEPHDFDGHLITFPSELIDIKRSPNGEVPQYRLTLDAGGTLVEAVLQQADAEALNFLQPESKLQVTGIVQLDYADYQEALDYPRQKPAGVKVLLRSADDIVVLQTPSWWTPRRLLGALAIGTIALGAILLWVWQLRRQLHRKSQQLAAEMHARRDAAIEFQATLRERNRLAANLHDTLLQNISGLNYQLEACETESLPKTERKANHLQTARRMVERAQDDLRGTVWALRVLPLHERNFSKALLALAEQLAEGRATEISVATSGELPQLSEFVAGNLLLVAQEAIHNALKHARPARIKIEVSAAADGKHITIVIRDDGAGFNPESQPPGHFGLDGMRERIERLGGKLRIESRPGLGTSVHAEVLLGSFDEDLA